MNVEKLIETLNNQTVTLVSNMEFENKLVEVTTLEKRLATTCEEGCLISGKELNSRPMDSMMETFLADNGMAIFDNDAVYCESIEEIYEVGKNLKDCISELSRGYISQLGCQLTGLEEEEYWETLFGSYPNARINEDYEVVIND
ncbi:hypothetical protein [Liquorilactobacillus mali]|uniref:Uncharacterized protein n=1 Tax=Liquorilactobacillus mali KCTC 3596 = DSM 20444 TaxID=1046596 RepID=A0A0R2EF72_9LACO|nr:hypothetical protein [Liquorilactobacillus mali]KRN10804.1 hypothetical protein FD00_GL002046 [Liquorilactobacillus mali KCTC 3596 = DSM 20444]